MLKKIFVLIALQLLVNACGSEAPNSETFGKNKAAAEPERLRECYKGDQWECEIEAEIVSLVNNFRRRPLKQSFETSFVARRWSTLQAKADDISHDGFPQQRENTLKAEFPAHEIYFRAENVAMGYISSNNPQQIAKNLFTQWYNSQGHRENMLGSYEFIGVGVRRQGQYVFGTQIFY